MIDLLDDLIAFFESRNTGNATNEFLNRCKKERSKQLLIQRAVVTKGTLCDGLCKVEATINAKEQCVRCGDIHKE